jgi:hypothetical protein
LCVSGFEEVFCVFFGGAFWRFCGVWFEVIGSVRKESRSESLSAKVMHNSQSNSTMDRSLCCPLVVLIVFPTWVSYYRYSLYGSASGSGP